MDYLEFDELYKKALRRGAVAGAMYHNIVVPTLSAENNRYLVKQDGGFVALGKNDKYIYENRYLRFVIRNSFPESYDEETIKHSFHKDNVALYDNDHNEIGRVDIYCSYSSKGFK